MGSLLIICCSKRQYRKNKSYDKRTAVAHEYFCWREVERKKTGECADKEQGERAYEDLTGNCRRDKENGRDYRCDTGGEAVHVVKEVEGIDYSYDPEDGKASGEDLVLYKEFDTDIGEDGGDSCNGELGGEFYEGI